MSLPAPLVCGQGIRLRCLHAGPCDVPRPSHFSGAQLLWIQRLSVESKAILLDRFRPPFNATELPKAALLQYSNGAEILNGGVGIERSRRLLAQELR
jgi:hypothetical protein